LTTHGAEECVLSCQLLADIICRALAGKDKETTLFSSNDRNSSYPESLHNLATGAYRDKSLEQIRGSGYVIESLEAALWSFYTTDNFKDAILQAANLGDDADTTAAICGQVAGAFYGIDNIPVSWLKSLAMKELIDEISVQLYNANQGHELTR
jgi:ADP-ribosyl-[dinitrogen reductase] hydrolase